MPTFEVAPGTVVEFRQVQTPCRVLAYDDGVVLYEAWLDFEEGWGFSSTAALTRRSLHYYAVEDTVVWEAATPAAHRPPD